MRIGLFFTSALALAFSFSIAQTGFKIKQGQQYKMISNRYSNDEVFMPSFVKMGDEKREKKVAAFNSKILSGEIKPTGVYDNTYLCKNVTTDNNNTNAIISTTIADKEYLYQVICRNDTLFCYRHIGPDFSVLNGDTIGMGLLGVQVLPNNLKVGDVLSPYEDIGLMFPKTKEYTTEYKKFIGREVNYTSQSILTIEHYRLIDVKVKETIQFGANTINYAIAKVIAEEEINIGNTKYKALRIESESWTKGKIDKSFEASNVEWQQERKGQEAELMAKMEKRGIKKGYTNKLGYIVTYKTEWFVPGIGIAKMDLYDNYGNLLSSSSMGSIN